MWKSDLDNKVLLPNGQPIPAVLLANKVIILLTNHILVII